MNSIPSVLIIEDDPTLVRGLKDNFESQGYAVRAATDGRSGLDSAFSDPPDLVVLDIMLPGMNGYEVCSHLRDNDMKMPIIMLTAKGQEEDIIRGLNVGADDYVTKPFNIRELLARASAFLRRYQPAESQTYRFGHCELNVDSHKLFRSGAEVALTAKEFRMLEYFVQRPGRALARNDIMDRVWGNSVIVTTRSVDRCIATLRAKIEPDAHHPTFIRTIRDIGYRFEIPESSETGEASADGRNGRSNAESDVLLASGSSVGRYTIEKLLGRGGMAEVYQAQDTRLGRHVALKVLSRDSAKDTDLVRRFEREAKVVAALSHPHIRAIYDVANVRGIHFAVMEFLEGQTLRDQLESSRLAAGQTIEIALAMAEGLAAAHEKGIVHRDVKPANVFLTKEGDVKILDFGLAHLVSSASSANSTTDTSPGRVMGTVNYMSPEQARGQMTDARTDIFSLGAVLFEMLTGSPPFVRPTAADTIAAILNDQPPAVDHRATELPSELNSIVTRCLSKDLAERHQTSRELCDALIGCRQPD